MFGFAHKLTTHLEYSNRKKSNIASYLLSREIQLDGAMTTTFDQKPDLAPACEDFESRYISERYSLSDVDKYWDFLIRKTPQALKENVYETSGVDKIFASAWISDQEVVLGTKCDKIVVLNTQTGKQIQIPSFSEYTTVQHVWEANVTQCSGIHAIAINPSKTLLAAGCGSASQSIQIYNLPHFEPVVILEGHTDMVFSAHWLDDQTLVSGSRDRSVKMWKIPPIASIPKWPITRIHCLASKMEHCDKVRDMVVDPISSKFYSLSADGYVKIWDAGTGDGLNVMAKMALIHTSETVCLAVKKQESIITVGSQSHITVLDPRAGSAVYSFKSLDEGWGVRSMDIYRDLVAIGGGYGRISCFDLRAGRYLNWDHGQKGAMESREECLQISSGWLQRDTIYQDHFQGIDVKNAVYTLSFNERRLFAAGGPLHLNLKGSYCSTWL